MEWGLMARISNVDGLKKVFAIFRFSIDWHSIGAVFFGINQVWDWNGTPGRCKYRSKRRWTRVGGLRGMLRDLRWRKAERQRAVQLGPEVRESVSGLGGRKLHFAKSPFLLPPFFGHILSAGRCTSGRQDVRAPGLPGLRRGLSPRRKLDRQRVDTLCARQNRRWNSHRRRCRWKFFKNNKIIFFFIGTVGKGRSYEKKGWIIRRLPRACHRWIFHRKFYREIADENFQRCRWKFFKNKNFFLLPPEERVEGTRKKG